MIGLIKAAILKWMVRRAIRRKLKSLRRERKVGMKSLSKWFHGVQWANAGVLVLEVINNVTGVVPDLAANKNVLIIQAILAAFLPGVGGFHKKLSGEGKETQ